MIKTTIQYFCDKCKEEIKDTPAMHYIVDENFSFGGCCVWMSWVDVAFTVSINGDENSKENILCVKCKIEALEELLQKLRKEMKDGTKQLGVKGT